MLDHSTVTKASSIVIQAILHFTPAAQMVSLVAIS